MMYFVPSIYITFIFILHIMITLEVRTQVTHTMTNHFDSRHTNKLFFFLISNSLMINS